MQTAFEVAGGNEGLRRFAYAWHNPVKEYLRWAGSRDRKRIKDLVSVEGALSKWILPVIGDVPL